MNKTNWLVLHYANAVFDNIKKKIAFSYSIKTSEVHTSNTRATKLCNSVYIAALYVLINFRVIYITIRFPKLSLSLLTTNQPFVHASCFWPSYWHFYQIKSVPYFYCVAVICENGKWKSKTRKIYWKIQNLINIFFIPLTVQQ